MSRTFSTPLVGQAGRVTGGRPISRRGLGTAAAALLALAGCSSSGAGPASVQGMQPSGFVTMRQVQAAYIASASTGSGTLSINGFTYPFNVGGAGIGGFGASTIEAEGEVYGLNDLAEFPGTYAQGRYGFAVGHLSAGDLWLQNDAGVILHLKAKRTGLMLSLGGDAVIISMS